MMVYCFALLAFFTIVFGDEGNEALSIKRKILIVFLLSLQEI